MMFIFIFGFHSFESLEFFYAGTYYVVFNQAMCWLTRTCWIYQTNNKAAVVFVYFLLFHVNIQNC